MPSLSTQDIDQIAALSRLSLTTKEKERHAAQLSAIFDYVEMLRDVPTDDVPETCQVTGLEDVFREDEAVPCDEETKKKLIAAFPATVGNLLKVPGVFEG